MTRVYSRFTCFNLKKYSWVKPRLSRLTYVLPVKQPFKTEAGSPAHLGPHSGAIDFLVPADRFVFAGQAGQVIEVVDHYSLPKLIQLFPNYWTTRLFRGRLNYITLRHKQKKIEEFSFYGHLKAGSSRVKPGERVACGQPIAQTGWSGWLDKPHLHFVIYTEKTIQFPQETHESLEPQWQDQS